MHDLRETGFDAPARLSTAELVWDADGERCRHDTAVAHGGTSIEGAPGPREAKPGAAHMAYVRDPDGNKLCAVYRPA